MNTLLPPEKISKKKETVVLFSYRQNTAKKIVDNHSLH
jgi:hypothetical protein